MPLSRPTYCGASVLSINNTIGWGSNGSELRVELVEDPTNGDVFAPGPAGGPLYFSLGTYVFNGLLKKYTKDKNRGGHPIYTVIVSDPRHLLDDAKIITSDYRLSISGIYNLFNVFGYWENTGYGNSQSNSTGMPWQLVRDAITTICNGAAGSFGGPISYRGTTYSINISALPPLPSYFRVGGSSRGLSILEFIQICCDAANYDYYIKLVGTTITLQTVARANAYPLGTIETTLTSLFTNKVLRSSVGIEERNETTSTFIIGGDVQTLDKRAITDENSFWGFYPLTPNEADVNNLVPIVGSLSGQRHANFYGRNNVIYTYPVKEYKIYIDSPTIATYTGATYYYTNDLELQVILGLGQHRNSRVAWARYLYLTNRAMYTQIALTNDSPNLIQPGVNNTPIIPNNTVNTGAAQIDKNQQERQGNLGISGNGRMNAVYDFLSKYARDFYGKKYAIYLPYVGRKYDTDSGAISYSHEITDGGWVDVADGNDLSGLPGEAYHKFQTQDGRFQAFCRFDATSADISRTNKNGTFQEIDSNILFSKIHIDKQLYFNSGNQCYAIIDTDPIYDYPDSIVGLSGVVGPLYVATGIYIEGSPGTITSEGQNALKDLINNGPQGSVPLVTHPRPRIPENCQLPIKSNVLTYGPWYAQGAAGRINYEQDPSLVPWNYGGYTNLNLAGYAKATDSVSSAQVIEAGYIEVEDYPAYNIGDVMAANGPNITNITVNFGKEGATTTYRFETYVPRPGQLGKYNIDAMRRLNIAGTELSRKVNSRLELLGLTDEVSRAAGVGANAFQAEMPEGIIQHSPANMLISRTVSVPSGVYSGHKFPVVSLAKLTEVVGLIPPSGEAYNDTATSSIESLVTPYSVFADVSGMPSFHTIYPPSNWVSGYTALRSSILNPFIECSGGFASKYYTKGTGFYQDLNDFNWSPSGQNGTVTGVPTLENVPKRVFGLRAPLVLGGWGHDIFGKRLGDYTEYISGIFPSGFLGSGIPETPWLSGIARFDDGIYKDFTKWKTGPIDALWDNDRKVWSVHDIMNVKAIGNIAGNASGLVGFYKTGSSSPAFTFAAFNWYNTSFSGGTHLTAGYIPQENAWYLLNDGGSNLVNTPGSTLPSGIPYTLLHTTSGRNLLWEDEPTIQGITLGGIGISGHLLQSGYIRLGTHEGTGSLGFRAQTTHSNFDYIFPIEPAATGQMLRVNSYNVGELIFNWGTPTVQYPGGTPQDIGWNNYSGVSEFYSREDHVHKHPVFSSGNLHPEYAGTGTIRYPGTGIQDISTSNSAGNSDLYARENHVHKHPIFLSGDLHPEYNLPVHSPYTLLWSDNTNTPVFWPTPTIVGLKLGGSGVTTGANPVISGILSFGTPNGSGILTLRAKLTHTDYDYILPARNPNVGDTLSVQSLGTNEALLDWASEVTRRYPGGNPVDIGTANASGISEYYARQDHVHKHPVFVTGDLHPEYNLPAGPNYSLLHKNASNINEWSRSPNISGLKLGGIGVSSESGYLDLGTPDGTGYLRLKGAKTHSIYGLTLPSRQPSVGDFLKVVNASSSDTILDYFAYSGASPGSNIQQTSSGNSGGTSNLFAREDHVHKSVWQIITYSGAPSFMGPSGWPVFNTFEHSQYISDGSLWWKFCNCGSTSGYNPGLGQLYTETFDSSTTWTCPAGVTGVMAECWGNGAHGLNGMLGTGGNGGGGGGYSKKSGIAVTPSSNYTVNVGVANAPNDTSYFINDSTVKANGANLTVGGTTGTGDTVYAGGNGANASGGDGGGGGGSATSTGAGGNATGTAGGSGEGTGGNGGSGSGNGTDGGIPGAGGGGGGGTGNGGNGKNGRVKLSYYVT